MKFWKGTFRVFMVRHPARICIEPLDGSGKPLKLTRPGFQKGGQGLAGIVRDIVQSATCGAGHGFIDLAQVDSDGWYIFHGHGVSGLGRYIDFPKNRVVKSQKSIIRDFGNYLRLRVMWDQENDTGRRTVFLALF
jgi:hypothetical protein